MTAVGDGTHEQSGAQPGGRVGRTDPWSWLSDALDTDEIDLLEDDFADIQEELVGPNHPLPRWIAGLVGRRAVNELCRLRYERTVIHQVLDDVADFRTPAELGEVAGGEWGPSAAPDADETLGTRALRVLAGLGLYLVEDEPEAGHLSFALSWFRQACSSPVTRLVEWEPNALADAVSSPDGRLRGRLERLASFAGEDRDTGAVYTTAVTLRFLAEESARSVRAGDEARAGRHTRGGLAGRLAQFMIPGRRARFGSWRLVVLFERGAAGERAELRGTLVRDLPAALVPDPASMALFCGDEAFQESIDRAWSQAGADWIKGSVLWSVEGTLGPLGHITDGSLGAAFAVLLDEVRRQQRPAARRHPLAAGAAVFTRLLRVRLLVPSNVVTGRIDRRGAMLSVGGYPRKLESAGDGARVIVPAADLATAMAAKGSDTQIIAVPTWRKAASCARRRNRRAVVRLAAALLVPALVTALAAGLKARSSMREAALERQDKQVEQLIRTSRTVRDNDPARALRLGLAAHQIRPGSATRAHLVETLLQTRYRGTLPETESRPSSLAFASGGRTLVSADRKEVTLWDVRSGVSLSRIPIEPGALEGTGDAGAVIAVADRVSLLAISGGNGVGLWNIATPARPTRTAWIPIPSGARLLKFRPDGRVLASCGGEFDEHPSGVTLWDTTVPARPHRLAKVTQNPRQGLAFDEAGHRIAVTEGVGAAVYDLSRASRPIHRATITPQQINPATDVAFGPDFDDLYIANTRPSAAGAGMGNDFVSEWSINGPGRPILLGVHRGQGEIETSPSGALAAIDHDGSIVIGGTYLYPDGKASVSASSAPPMPVGETIMAFSPDDRMIAIRGRGARISLWETGGLGGFTPAKGMPGFGDRPVVNPRGTLLAGRTSNGTSLLYDISAPGRYERLARLPADARPLSFSPDGRTLLAAQAGGAIVRLDVSRPRRLKVAQEGSYLFSDGVLLDAATAPGGRAVVAAAQNQGVFLWDAAQLWSAEGPQALIGPETCRSHATEGLPPEDCDPVIAFADDKPLLAVGGIGANVSLWNVVDPHRPHRVADVPADGTGAVPVFASGGDVLITGHRRWDIHDPERPHPLDPLALPEESTNVLAYGQHGGWASTRNHRDTTIWYLGNGLNPFGVADSIQSGPPWAVYVPGGRVVSTSYDKTEFLDLKWITEVADDPVRSGCGGAGRGLTRKEWHAEVPLVPYRPTCR
ncbi:WD40 repeat domain-containing protein [Actinomadura formosensis]|uniref:WD40 repeat domain-containing protein n=1 Tax=Actinomadura formosensis TaxID=60706 RepID=UPI003D8DE1B1